MQFRITAEDTCRVLNVFLILSARKKEAVKCRLKIINTVKILNLDNFRSFIYRATSVWFNDFNL